ncbi:MAG: ComEC/Rec2 family competence protein, partial [Calditerrivibrio sp.]|nr:ComEC/Rec2 family competence protein [Calditerrivibrio sp.]
MGKIGLVSSVHKIELLFIFSLLVSIIPVNSLLKSSFLLTLFILFHRGYRIKTFLSILILFILLNNFSAFVVDKNLNNDGSFSYYSVNGSLKGDYLNVGDVIVGRFKTENRGNFIQYIVEQEFFRMRVPIYSYLIELRDRKVENLYFLSNKKITLLLAVFYGEKRYISDEVNELFTIAGLNHLLAISGQHVGIILMMIFIFLYRIDFKIRFLIGMISVVLFIPIAGFKIPVIRAAIFVTILAFTYLFDRKVVLRKLVLWVAVTFMIVDPDIIYSPSFCLSFLAVLGISLISDDFFKENKFINSILVGIYATAFTLPYIAYK